jgi:hypothetical protein
MWVMSHRILHDLLEAFSSEGPGSVNLAATAAGTKIPDEQLLQIVTPTWGGVNNILILPTPVPGKIVIIAGAATGGELRSSNPATIAINGGTGANAESAVAANAMVVAICESPTSWKAFTLASNGTIAGLQVAAP